MTIIASNPDDETAYAEQARPRIAATLRTPQRTAMASGGGDGTVLRVMIFSSLAA